MGWSSRSTDTEFSPQGLRGFYKNPLCDARFQHAVSTIAVRIAGAFSRALDLNKPLSGRNASYVVLAEKAADRC